MPIWTTRRGRPGAGGAILKAQGSTVVLVTHRPGILAVADRVMVLSNGVLQADGPRDAVLAALRATQAPVALS